MPISTDRFEEIDDDGDAPSPGTNADEILSFLEANADQAHTNRDRRGDGRQTRIGRPDARLSPRIGTRRSPREVLADQRPRAQSRRRSHSCQRRCRELRGGAIRVRRVEGARGRSPRESWVAYSRTETSSGRRTPSDGGRTHDCGSSLMLDPGVFRPFAITGGVVGVFTAVSGPILLLVAGGYALGLLVRPRSRELGVRRVTWP